MTPLVELRNLRVTAGETVLVKDIGFTIGRGEVVALIGESGSGKTTTALSLLGYARRGCTIAAGEIHVAGYDVRSLDDRQLRRFRGQTVAYVAQSAAASFNPARSIMDQVVEGPLIHHQMTRDVAEAKARDLFRILALPDPDRLGERFPHQLSGGQLQRLLAAMALIGDPELVIFDEPTTALDVTTQIEVLRAFKTAIRERNTTGLYVSHDLAVVAQIADRIIVLKDGCVREEDATSRILSSPADDYTKSLLAAAAPAPHGRLAAAGPPILAVTDLTAGYRPDSPILKGVSFTLRRGESFGVVGESGCGKSTLARVIAGLLPRSGGSIELDGKTLSPSLAKRSRDELRRVQIVFQSADTALNPAVGIGDILARPLAFYHGLAGADLQRRTERLLDLVQLPKTMASRHPRELSGGQRQRVNLARALAAEPQLVLCDEVTSALDTVVAAAILDLLEELRRELHLTTLFISHDLNAVRALCDRVMVLYAGAKVETDSGFTAAEGPHHPYARLLMESVPELRPGWLETAAIPEPAQVADPAGCAFYPRCGARLEGVCDRRPPPEWRAPGGVEIVCHRSGTDLA